MPCKSKAQSRACFAQQRRDLAAGRIPRWNCQEWSDKTNYQSLPNKKSRSRKSRSRKSRRSYTHLSPSKDRKRKIHVGPRGGKYKIVHGHKVYI